MSLRNRARAAYAVVALVGLVGVVLSAVAFRAVLDERSRLAGSLDPAAFAGQRWLVAYLDQESGVRGYVLSGDADFLAPYFTGIRGAKREEASTRSLLRDEARLLRYVDRFDRAADRWRRTQGEPLVRQTRKAGPSRVSTERLIESKAAFDALRVAYADLDRELDEARSAGRARRDDRTRELAVSLAATVGLLAFGIAGTWAMLSRWVLDPLLDLGSDARQVAEGDLSHEVDAIGAPEISSLARDMESMRQRIVAEVAVVEAARVRLEAQATDLARSNQELEQFAYVASHDLQEPLRKISGFCQLLERRYAGQLDERADEYIAFAVDGAKRMQRLINELLAFSRVGRTSSRFTQVDLAQIASVAVGSLGDVIEESGAVVEIGALPTVVGDATLLEVLLQNLVANAVKFRGDDPPVVHLDAAPSTAPDGTSDGWTVTCRDNGIGIEPEYAERVFVIFQRLHARDVYEGTGIGLAMCRKIVEFHGGRIWVEQGSGSGTRISFTLPSSPRVAPDPHDDPTPSNAGADT